MNIRIFHFFALFLALVAVTANIPAAEVYMWVDEQGIRHITDRPPDKAVKMIGQERYRKDSPEEIRLYQIQQERLRLMNEREAELGRQRQQYREAAEKWRDENKKEQRESELRRAKEALDFEEKYQNRYDDRRRNAKSQWEINMYDDLKKDQDKEVEAKRRKLRELENK